MQDRDHFANRISSGLDFDAMLDRLLRQNGYASDNTRKGLKTALKDYDAIFHQAPPAWLDLVWPSVAMSIVHLAIAQKKRIPESADLPQQALKNGL